MKKLLLLVIAAMILLTACAPKAAEMPKAELPAGRAWAEGKEIYFVHTEASDPGVAEKLTGADLVITAEGQIDFQTAFGKAPAGS